MDTEYFYRKVVEKKDERSGWFLTTFVSMFSRRRDVRVCIPVKDYWVRQNRRPFKRKYLDDRTTEEVCVRKAYLC